METPETNQQEEHSFNFSDLRGVTPITETHRNNTDDDLNGLAEIVPDVKNRTEHPNGMTLGEAEREAQTNGEKKPRTPNPEDDAFFNSRHNNKMSLPEDSSSEGIEGKDINEVIYGNAEEKEDVNSDRALSSAHSKPKAPEEMNDSLGLGEFQNMSSAQSLSTATQTHEVRMPMYLPTFKPATGCTNASDFIVRCFVARLRSGITVVKHGRSRWCKSRLRILHIHPDGRSLSWKPAQGEPNSSKRPPKLDLTSCLEVRHAWSPDPQNPMYTGTPILRQKCEAANAHKSFALIFPKRTVDITSVTADQCKVLMEGFSALCFRLQVANLVGKGDKKGGQKMPEDEEAAATSSVVTSN